MALDRPVHAPEAADGTTANEAGAGVRLPGQGTDKHAHRHAPSPGAYALADGGGVALSWSAPAEANYAQG